MSWSDLDLTFDLVIVTLTYKILSGLYLAPGGRAGGPAAGKRVCPGCISETIRCRKLILGRDIG